MAVLRGEHAEWTASPVLCGSNAVAIRCMKTFVIGEYMSRWIPIGDAPTDGTVIRLLVEFEHPLETFGCWDGGCFRYVGDDGPFDIQPSGYLPIPSKQEICQ